MKHILSKFQNNSFNISRVGEEKPISSREINITKVRFKHKIN